MNNKKILGIMFLITLLSAASGYAALTDGLINYWSFDVNATDSIRGAALTANGAANAGDAGKINGATFCDGGGDYWNTANDYFDNLKTIGTFSIAFWGKINDADIVANWEGAWLIRTDSPSTQWSVEVSGGGAAQTTGITADNTWQYIVMTYNGSKVAGYTNGVYRVGATQALYDIISLNRPFVLCAGWDGLEEIEGSIDEVGIWNRSITQDEITQLYNGGSGLAWPFTGGGGDPGDTLNITAAVPSNASQFNSNSLKLNVTFSNSETPANCSLFINGTLNQTVQDTTNGSATIRFNKTLADGYYNYFFSCANPSVTENSTLSYFFIDTVNPGVSTNFLNFSFWAFQNITAHWNLSDDQILSSLNVTIDGAQINYTTLNSATYRYNLSYNPQLLSPGAHNLTLRIADGHTAQTLKQDYEITKDKDLMIKPTKERLIRIKETRNQADAWTTSRLYDRYSLEYTPEIPSNTYIFDVTSNDEIRVINAPWTEYKSWLIIGDQWLDFMIEGESPVINFEQQNKNKVVVTISNLNNPSKLKFNSIGDLNIIYLSYNFTTTNATLIYSTSISELEYNTLSLLINKTAVITQTNATLVWNGTIYNATKTNTSTYDLYNVTFLTPAISNASVLVPFYWNYSIIGLSNNETGNLTRNQTIYGIGIDNCSVYTTPAINFSLYTTEGQRASGSLAGFITAWIDDPDQYETFNVSWGDSHNFTMCISPSNGNYTINGQYEYENVTYGNPRTYYQTNYILDNISNNIVLYFNQNNTLVKFTVTDQNDNDVQDVFIHVLQYDLTTNSSKLVEILKTDSNGEAIASSIILNTQWYKFILFYNNNVVLETAPTKITTTSRSFRINLLSDYFETYDKVREVSCRTTFTNATKTFSFIYADPNTNISQACLEVTQRGLNGDIQVGRTCQTSTSGTISINIGNNTGSNTYLSSSTIYYGNEVFQCGESVSASFDDRYRTFGSSGLFVSFLILLTMVMIGIWDARVSIILQIGGLILLFATGLFYLSWPIFISLVIVTAIYLYKVNR